MLITVIYQNNRVGIVDASHLFEVITSNKIKKFLRFEGWVTIGVDPIRKATRHNYKGPDYKGPERRWHIEKVKV
jgi:hypothetical protein